MLVRAVKRATKDLYLLGPATNTFIRYGYSREFPCDIRALWSRNNRSAAQIPATGFDASSRLPRADFQRIASAQLQYELGEDVAEPLEDHACMSLPLFHC